MKRIAGSLKLELAQYREVAGFAQLDSNLDEETSNLLKRGSQLTKLLNQDLYQPVAVELQITLLYGAVNNYLMELADDELANYQQHLFDFLLTSKIFNPHLQILRNNNLAKQYSELFFENLYAFYPFF
jgi:F-type H+-transporting ATPase subunit alpha